MVFGSVMLVKAERLRVWAETIVVPAVAVVHSEQGERPSEQPEEQLLVAPAWETQGTASVEQQARNCSWAAGDTA